jgi:hypothetical protein
LVSALTQWADLMPDDRIEVFIGLIESIDTAAGALRATRNAWPLQEAAE